MFFSLIITATLTTIVSDRDIEDVKCSAHAKHVFIFQCIVYGRVSLGTKSKR